MITLYRKRDSRPGDDVEESLRELVLAHEVVHVDSLQSVPADVDGTLPVLVEGEDVYAGSRIQQFIERRANRLHISRRMSADACFVDPDDPTNCI